MQRVSVIGNTGSGKSTVARRLAASLGAPHIELDALHWGAKWSEATADELRARVAPLVAGERWVVDGMYWRKIGGLVLERADTVVWIDPPWIVTFFQLLRRSLSRMLRRTALYNGNRESFRGLFLSRDSLLLFSIRTRPRRRELFQAWLARPEFEHLKVRRFASTDAALRWAASVTRD